MSIERRYALLKHNHLHSENTGGLITLTTGSPTVRMKEDDAPVDNQVWDINADGGDLKWRLVKTDLTVATDFFIVNRTGIHADAMRFIADIIVAQGYFAIPDGVTAPGAIPGLATIYVDTTDGDLKVRFGDGTIKTIVVDT